MGASRKIGGLTFQERKLVKEYVKNGGKGRLAAQKAYPNANPNSQAKIASAKLNKPEIKNAIIKALDKAGLNEDYIADTIKKNIPENAIGKGATAATINKSLELLIKLRDEGKINRSESINLHVFQDIEKLSNSELLEKRAKSSNYFTKIIDQ